VNSVLLLGDPVSRSLSPGMQNAAFKALGIDCRYVLREVNRAGLAGAMAQLRGDQRILGANVTIPHKESVIPYLDDLDAQAARIGAVNTISRQGARLKGWNTDAEGFQRALSEMEKSPSPDDDVGNSPSPLRGEGRGGGLRVAIIGAGGAARAVAAGLQPAAEVWVVARNVEQARRLCHDLEIVRGGPIEMDHMQEAVAKAHLVVNATPADLPPASWLRTDQVLFDLRSRRSAEGRAMLLHQGAASFEIWTGRKAPIDVMRAALDRASVPA
jgi:shikimate dehydrogenase